MSGHHIVSVKLYFGVFFALCALTFLTYWTALHDYGAFNTPLALAIAGVKAALVILFFMHAKYSSKLTQLFAFAGFFWLAILLVFTLQDFMTRDLLPFYFWPKA
ncbi:MAG TPA: cytochrome C oxidase subunit IV family protein [Planctomycetota bacterium]|nr:cytochrome C oxidase subunit IV family protein [Planctomycetota bacterium]